MDVLGKLRVYRELLTVLVSTLVALAIWQRCAPDVRAYAAEDRADEEALSPEALGDDGDPPAATMSAGGTASAQSAAPVLPAGKERMLILGDSMVEVLDAELNAYAIENGHELVPAIWYGSTTSAWANSPDLGRLLREINPTMVMVVLGSSELTRRSIASRRPFVEALVRRIGPRKLVWIGPPNWRPDTGINDLLESVLGKDRFFRSEDLELSRKKDGIHPDAAGGRVWMAAIARWLATESRFGLELKSPSRTAAAPPARVLGRM